MPLDRLPDARIDRLLSLRAALDGLLSLVAPPFCWGCGVHARGGPLCAGCRTALEWLGPASVELRGVETWAPVAYDGPARELVKALKYRGAQAVAETMAAQIAAGAPAPMRLGAVLVPVPLHPRRERKRGFNQARVLADALVARLGVEVRDSLERRGSSATQVGRPREERLRAATGSVALRAGTTAPGAALLVDDVVTTGATLATCAAALRAAGSREVAALAYARTPSH
ncbi:MAG: hypothetical protein WD649_00105 [Thermoleophilaceae bacterium]